MEKELTDNEHQQNEMDIQWIESKRCCKVAEKQIEDDSVDNTTLWKRMRLLEKKGRIEGLVQSWAADNGRCIGEEDYTDREEFEFVPDTIREMVCQ